MEPCQLPTQIRHADREATALLDRIGSPDLADDEVTALCDLLVSSGAVDEVERSIQRLVDESMTALHRADISDDARHALAELGNFVAWRDR